MTHTSDELRRPNVREIEPGRRWAATLPGAAGLAAEAFLGRVHPGHAWLVEDGRSSAADLALLVGALSDAVGRPLAAKVEPDTDAARRLLDAGAVVYQVVPPNRVDLADPANLRWASEPVTDAPTLTNLSAMTPDEIVGLWLRLYRWVHLDWSPMGDEDAARAVFAEMLASDLLADRSVVATRAGRPTAVAFAFYEDADLLVVCESVERESPTGAVDVDACLRAAARNAAAEGRCLFVDGHITDPHLYPALQCVPVVTGPGLNLVEFAQRRPA